MRTASQIAAYYKQLATDYAGQALLRRCRASIHLENRDDEWYWTGMLQKYQVPARIIIFITVVMKPELKQVVARNACNSENICHLCFYMY